MLLSSVLMASVLAGVAATPTVRAYLSGLDRTSRAILAGFIGLMTLGQLVDQPRLTFPFSVFHMFGAVHRDAGRGYVSVFDIRGIGPDGRRVPINPERLIPSMGMGTMRMGIRIRVIIDSALESDKGRPQLDAVLDGIADAHRRMGYGPLCAVEVVRRDVPVRPASGPTESQVVWTRRVGGGSPCE